MLTQHRKHRLERARVERLVRFVLVVAAKCEDALLSKQIRVSGSGCGDQVKARHHLEHGPIRVGLSRIAPNLQCPSQSDGESAKSPDGNSVSFVRRIRRRVLCRAPHGEVRRNVRVMRPIQQACRNMVVLSEGNQRKKIVRGPLVHLLIRPYHGTRTFQQAPQPLGILWKRESVPIRQAEEAPDRSGLKHHLTSACKTGRPPEGSAPLREASAPAES